MKPDNVLVSVNDMGVKWSSQKEIKGLIKQNSQLVRITVVTPVPQPPSAPEQPSTSNGTMR